MNLFTDVEIGKLSLVLIVLIAFFSLEVLKSNAVRPLLPRRFAAETIATLAARVEPQRPKVRRAVGSASASRAAGSGGRAIGEPVTGFGVIGTAL